jgi:hypothetical protein
MKGFSLALIVGLAGCASAASATIVDVSFAATDGSDLSGSFSYDAIPEVSDSGSLITLPPGYDSGHYGNYSHPFSLTINGVSYIAPQYNDIDVGTPASGVGPDYFYNYSIGGGSPYTAYYLLSLVDSTGGSLNGTSLPTDFHASSGTLSYDAAAFGGDSRSRITVPISATFSAVTPTPELPAWVSMVLGLGLVGGVVCGKRGSFGAAASSA